MRPLANALDQQAFLFEGPSGVGKTTLARIVAREHGCTEVIEIDAATHTGVDATREVARRADYTALDGDGKAFIIDECHRLSKQAWESLLKDIEEPPRGVLWMFCTTEGARVPKTIRTRCMAFTLRLVAWRALIRLCARVAEAEGMEVAEDVLAVAAAEAGGSPRQALVNLATIAGCADPDTAREALSRAPVGVEAFDLAKLICGGSYSFANACEVLSGLQEVPPESVRQVVRAYATTAILNGGTRWHRGVLLAFEKPAVEQNGVSDILIRLITLEKWKSKGGDRVNSARRV